mmetsp:Transcript_52107/g.158255  ORF Transcript_52107/g.158255 Transcript_52107/m.158255 type:complete len:239 (-) Transcript_52107:84-800(-)
MQCGVLAHAEVEITTFVGIDEGNVDGLVKLRVQAQHGLFCLGHGNLAVPTRIDLRISSERGVQGRELTHVQVKIPCNIDVSIDEGRVDLLVQLRVGPHQCLLCLRHGNLAIATRVNLGILCKRGAECNQLVLVQIKVRAAVRVDKGLVDAFLERREELHEGLFRLRHRYFAVLIHVKALKKGETFQLHRQDLAGVPGQTFHRILQFLVACIGNRGRHEAASTGDTRSTTHDSNGTNEW